MNTIKNEPVLTAGAVVGAIMATLAALVALGVININPEQMGAIGAALTAVVGLALPVVGAFVARQYVTPVSNPKDNEGNALTP
jgi:uncharacterized membrane protein (Fun14 family)